MNSSMRWINIFYANIFFFIELWMINKELINSKVEFIHIKKKKIVYKSFLGSIAIPFSDHERLGANLYPFRAHNVLAIGL